MEIDFKDWYNYEGELEQGEFVKRTLISIIGSLILTFIPVLGWIACLALAVMGIFAVMRRLRGLGMNPWLTLICFIPLIGLIFLIYLMVKK